jgi:hypothetical protein
VEALDMTGDYPTALVLHYRSPRQALMPNHRIRFALIAALAIAVLAPATVGAHERKIAGRYQLVIGWGDEPAFSGVKNAVEVDVTDSAGAPVTDLGGGTLSVEVIFGDQRVTLPLRAVRQPAGKFQAWLVPTRAGTYTFHISGTIKGEPLDVSSTCSDTTFACVGDVADLQFPAKDPSPGQLADRLSRGLPRAEEAVSAAGSARVIAFAAIALAAVAIAVAIIRTR